MQVTDNTAVTIHYTLTNAAGETLDSSIGGEALVYLHGQGNIIPGLEKALVGKASGDKLNVSVAPTDAYGEYSDEKIQAIPLKMFEDVDSVEVGMQFHADMGTGSDIVTVIKIEGDKVTIDANHPLAGEALNFNVEIVDVRAATEDELAHGHVHGAGCHH